MNIKIRILLIFFVFIILYFIINKFMKNKDKFERIKMDIDNKEYKHKIFQNEDLLEESNKTESEIRNVLNEIENFDKKSILAEVDIIKNLVPKKDCLWIIYEAERFAAEHGGWGKDRHSNYPTVDIDIRRIYLLENYLYNITYSSIFPKVAEKFNLNPKYLGINEIFIVKYNLNGQTKLKEHQDGSEFSFIIPLNKDYEGGGTKFKFLKDKIDTEIGNCVIFCGKHRHKGIEIKSGERYILAGFLNYGWED